VSGDKPDLRAGLDDLAAAFLDLHRPGRPLLLPNPWDVGSARVLASLGFQALATTSSGFAATLGRPDGSVSRDEAIGHARAIVQGTPLPVSADLENGFGDDPSDVAETVTSAIAAGLAGCSIEDSTGRQDDPIYELEHATARISAAAEVAHASGHRLVLTARAENYLHGRAELADTITRLQRYAEAGADVLYAPGLTSAADISAVVSSVDRPLNVLALASAPTVAELAQLGVARISVGGAFAYAAYGALAAAARELMTDGTYGFWAAAASGRQVTSGAFVS
jgi:2-methylisocitrate lyase-like PEP mutase family enzyme